MSWGKFKYRDNEYLLDHLAPFDWTYQIEVGDGKPPEIYKFHIAFSHHCFTSNPDSKSPFDQELQYPNEFNDGRQFDFRRYEHSKRLRKIIESLHKRTCLQTNHRNFLRIEIIDEKQENVEYEVYFRVTKTAQKGWLRLYVESAYVRDEDRKGSRPKTQNIKLRVIARNTQMGKKIKRSK